MATISGGGDVLEVTRLPQIHVFEVAMSLTDDGATGTIDIPLCTLPKGTRITDVVVEVMTAEAGATSAALDIEVGAIDLLDCGADSLGTVNRKSASVPGGTYNGIGANTALSAAASLLNCEVTIVGTATTAPVFYIFLTAYRPYF